MIETKTSKVKEIKRFSDSVDDYGNYSFSVSFENGDAGYLKGKDKDHPYFIAGQEVPYTIEEIEKKDKSGTYFKIKKPAKEWTGGGGGAKWQPKTPLEYKSDMISCFMRYAVDILIAQSGEVTEKSLKDLVYPMVKVAYPMIDKIYGDKK